jgi:hypothetical protein
MCREKDVRLDAIVWHNTRIEVPSVATELRKRMGVDAVGAGHPAPKSKWASFFRTIKGQRLLRNIRDLNPIVLSPVPLFVSSGSILKATLFHYS